MAYVWGLHDFAREHEDEIDFKAGDRILVVEKDDLYQDGWWRGTNPAGQTGLFPMSYTAPHPPGVIPMAPASQILGSHLQPLAEESDSQAEDHEEHQAPRGSGPDTVMNATMTDIREAIEQLGVQDNREDASRSFSFASTRDDTLTDEEGKAGSEHYDARDARAVLAQNAFRQNNQRSSKALQSHRPPIQVEMSDESEDEEGPSPRQQAAVFPHNAPMLHSTKDLTESPMSNLQSPLILQETIKEESEQEEGPPSEHRALVFATSQPSANGHARHDTVTTIQQIPTVKGETEEPRTFSEAPAIVSNANTVERVVARSTSPPDRQRVTENVNIELSGEEIPQFSPPGPASSSPTKSQAPSISSFRPSYVAQDIVRASSPPAAASPADLSVDLGNVSPGDWSVDQVIAWLKSRNFDDGICEKFAEHEISGDVLLELDLNMLKELEIQAFGKRMKIMHAINDLKNDLKQPTSAFSSAPSTHYLRGQSPLQQSSPYGHSARSPSVIMYSPESVPHVNDFATSAQYGLPISASVPVHADPGGTVMTNEFEGLPTDGRAIGLGVVDAEATRKQRPVSLSLSPSDGALSAKALKSAHSKKTSTSSAAVSQVSDGGDKDRLAITDTESAPTSLRRKAKRRFMRPASRDRAVDSDGTSVPPSPSPGSRNGSPTTEKTTPHKGKRNSDPVTKSSTDTHRHSFFGAMGKSRKPAPRYSESSQDISPTSSSHDKVPRPISRLHLSGSTKRPRVNENGISSEAKLASSPKNVLQVSPTVQLPAYRDRPVSASLGNTFLEQIGEFDHDGWMRKKGERYSSWKLRYFVLKGPHLYYLRGKGEAKIKGYINIKGYRIIADENIYPGRYGFRIVHDTSASHYFSSDEQITIREWMKALMKATIVRDYTKAVISSVNMPTIPLSVAQTMSPPPRPPSPAARDATQRAMRRENTSQLSTRDTRVLGLSPENRLTSHISDVMGDNTTLGGDGSTLGPPTPHVDHTPRATSAPVRPVRRQNENNIKSVPVEAPQDVELLKWVNSHLKGTKLKATDLSASLSTGLILYRVAEHIKGIPYGSEVVDSAFPTTPTDEKLDGLFILFDFLLDNDIRMGSVSINDVRQGNHEKLVQLVKSLRSWEEKMRELEGTMHRSTSGAMHSGFFMGAP